VSAHCFLYLSSTQPMDAPDVWLAPLQHKYQYFMDREPVRICFALENLFNNTVIKPLINFCTVAWFNPYAQRGPVMVELPARLGCSPTDVHDLASEFFVERTSVGDPEDWSVSSVTVYGFLEDEIYTVWYTSGNPLAVPC
ncbi:hypothetical protein DXG01_012156, partial [Tephrocybe rancida]